MAHYQSTQDRIQADTDSDWVWWLMAADKRGRDSMVTLDEDADWRQPAIIQLEDCEDDERPGS